MKKSIPLIAFPMVIGISAAFLCYTHWNTETSSITIGKYSPRTTLSENHQTSHSGSADYLSSVRGNFKTGTVSSSDLQQALDHIKNHPSRSDGIGLEFEFMGPANIGGRTRGIVIDNQDPQRIYAASVSGGIFVSNNAGSTWSKSWTHRTNNISSLTQASDGKLYAGTGCTWESSGQKAGAPDAEGRGIFVSEDRGATWKVLESTKNDTIPYNFGVVNEVKAHPTLPNVIAAGTNRGIFISTDGGKNWSNKSACQGPVPAFRLVHTLDWSVDGKTLFVGFSSGHLYSGELYDSECGLTDRGKVGVGANIGSDNRWKITVSPSDPNVVYAATSSSGNLQDILISRNKGVTWESFNPGIPTSAQHFALFGNNQADYDLLFKAVPNLKDQNSDVLFMGGVQLWRFDGNWTMAAVSNSAGGPPNPYGVHVDHHICTYDKNNPKHIFFGNDGGVFKSMDGGYTFFDINKGFTTTQFYAIDYANFDYVVGGTQDNGNLFVTSHRPGNSDYGAGVFNNGILNGDGWDPGVSHIMDLKYTSSQHGNVGRGRITSTQGSAACAPYCGMSKFYTNFKLWESLNDPTSKDSVVYVNDTLTDNVGLGTGSRKTFEGKIVPEQASAQIIPGSIRIGTTFAEMVYDGHGGFKGDGTGSLNEKDFTFSVTFNDAPQQFARVNVHYTVRFDAGSVITVASSTDEIPIVHVNKTNLEPGDVLKIQDPIQSIIGMQVNQRCDQDSISGTYTCQDPNYPINSQNYSGPGQPGLLLARRALVLGKNPEWWYLATGEIEEFEFSHDGNEVFYNMARGDVVRMHYGLNDVYSQHALDNLDPAVNVPTGLSGTNVTSITFNPTNPHQILFTSGNYNSGNHISLVDRMVNTTNFLPPMIKQGNLPDMPVYDAIFDAENPNRVIIGTDMGIWSTNDIHATNVVWVQEDFPNVPVFDIDQQILNHQRATNHGMVYVGTHGAGVWKSGTIVGVEEIEHNRFADGQESQIRIFPNPAQNQAILQITSNQNSEVDIVVYDLSGQVVEMIPSNLNEGDNDISFDVSHWTSGTYIISVGNEHHRSTGRLVKM